MVLVVVGLGRPVKVLAGDEACTDPEYPYCYDYTIINQWACETCPGHYHYICSNSSADHIYYCEDENGRRDPDKCTPYGDNVVCYKACIDNGTIHQNSCKVLQLNAQCKTSAGYCRWQGLLTNCVWSGGNCSEPSQTSTKSCCGCPNPPCGGGGGGGGGGSPTPTPSPTPPPVCTATYPAAATLTYPPNNGQVSGSQVSLQWQAPGDWGTGCPENNNHYLLNVYNMTDGQFVKDAGGNDYNHKWIGAGQTSETVPLGAAPPRNPADFGRGARNTEDIETPQKTQKVVGYGRGSASPIFWACGHSMHSGQATRCRPGRGAAPLRPYETLAFLG